MKKLLFALFGLALCAGLHAQSSVTQTVTFQVLAINLLSVSGNPGTLSVSGGTAGSAPTAATDSSTTYAITTNATGQKITGALSSAMPTGTTLSVSLAAPSGATSAGAVALTTTATNLVSNISTLIAPSQGITYSFAATAAAGQIASTTRTVTLTLLAGP